MGTFSVTFKCRPPCQPSTFPVESYIAPWALPREKFPFHLTWESNMGITQIDVILPEGLQFVSAYNAEAQLEGNTVHLRKSVPWDYVTVFVSYNTLPEESVKKSDVRVTLKRRGRVIVSTTLVATVVRPRLEILEAPTELTLTDAMDANSIFNTKLRQTGFGPVRIYVEASFRGKVVTQRSLFARQLLRSMARSGLLDGKASVKEDKTSRAKASVDSQFTDDMISEIDHIIREGLADQDLDEETIKGFRELLHEKGPEAFTAFLKAGVERFLIDFILSLVNRFPGEQAELVGGPTRALLDTRMDSLTVTIQYEDLLGNRYGALSFNTAFKDMRSRPLLVTIPLNFTVETNLVESL